MATTRQTSWLKSLLLAFAVALCVCSLSYALASSVSMAYRDFVAWPLLPGVVVYAIANGSLLFPSGHGVLGSFATVVPCSALAWAMVFTVVRLGFRRWGDSKR
jgi:hypothetical protein